jgi:inositol transport system substrate-binding protein
MKRMIALAAATLLSSPAFATKIGVSMDKFDDNFLTVLRNGMSDYAKTLPGVTLQVEDAKDDVSKQLSQVQNFIANGVDAIIVNPVDTSATAAITKAAADAGVPLVYVNRSRRTSTSSAPRPPSSPRTKLNPARSRPRKSASCSAARAISW